MFWTLATISLRNRYTMLYFHSRTRWELAETTNNCVRPTLVYLPLRQLTFLTRCFPETLHTAAIMPPSRTSTLPQRIASLPCPLAELRLHQARSIMKSGMAPTQKAKQLLDPMVSNQDSRWWRIMKRGQQFSYLAISSIFGSGWATRCMKLPPKIYARSLLWFPSPNLESWPESLSFGSS